MVQPDRKDAIFYLDERDLQCGDLSVHEDASEVKLDLEANIHIRPVDCW